MVITGGSALPKDEIERMMKDAEAHANEDKERREAAEARNAGDSLLYQTEKFLKDNEAKLAEGEMATKKSEVENALADLKKSLEGSDTASIKSATDKVAEVSQALGAALYAAGAAAGASESSTDGAGSSSSNEDGVEDAEIVEEK
jgi:molecular chaperone DnaK